MLRICCVRAGAAFAPAYVSNLADMVRRNLADGMEGEFICFTDQPDDYGPGITVRPLPADLPSWWSKLALHRDGLFDAGDRILFLDLDTLITGRLDEIAAYDGPFAILRDFYRPDGLQSAVMTWEAGTTTDIWASYEAAGCPQDVQGGDQAWIEVMRLDSAVRLQDAFPDLFCSYKLIKGPPAKASVVCFHGKPRPHEVLTGWVPEVWKIGGMSRADLDVVCNTANERLLDNVRSSIARKLPWFDLEPEHDGHAVIVAGGPSAKDFIEEIRWRESIGQMVFAMNGSARFLNDHEIIPDVYVMADAREENCAMLHGTSRWTTHLIASQCHPAVFDALANSNVVLWHTNSEGMVDLLGDVKDKPVHLIGGGSTVGLNAIMLAFGMGFRKIHLYGFDSSYREGEHHAYPQGLNDGDRVIDALYGERSFKTTAWMAQQVNEFQDTAPGLVADGVEFTIHGDGLFQTVARDLVASGAMSPAQVRASGILHRLNGSPQPHGVEIGVFAGETSASLLRAHPTLCLDMVDSWEGQGAAYEGDSGDFHAELTQDTQDAFMQQAERRTDFAKDRANIIRLRSTEAAEIVSDASRDFVFIDADHSYEGCAADIAAWAPKVKPGGWLCGHDYENTGYPKFGVTQAVNEYAQRTGFPLELGENFTWFLRIPH